MRGTLVTASRHCESSRGTPRLRRPPRISLGARRLAARPDAEFLVDTSRELSNDTFTLPCRHTQTSISRSDADVHPAAGFHAAPMSFLAIASVSATEISSTGPN